MNILLSKLSCRTLGSFRTFRSRKGRPRGKDWLCFVPLRHDGWHRQALGLDDGLLHPLAANWVRLARWAPATAPPACPAGVNWVRLAHFALCRPEAAGRRSVPNPRSEICNREIGFVLTTGYRLPTTGHRVLAFACLSLPLSNHESERLRVGADCPSIWGPCCRNLHGKMDCATSRNRHKSLR
jgi:hypothetical protein